MPDYPSLPLAPIAFHRFVLPFVLFGLASPALAQTPTQTRLALSMVSSQPGQPVTLTARVESLGQASPQTTPTGPVIFQDDGIEIGRVALEAMGVEMTEVAVGGFHVCALALGGQVYCWGSGEFGQLGQGSTDSALVPAPVPGLSDATALTAGDQHSCAIVLSGAVRCWGWGTEGQLGNGQTTGSSVPVTVTGISSAISISAGGLHTCAALTSGHVQCWGRGTQGQLGNGARINSSVPVQVSGLSDAVEVALGGQHSCARLAAGSVQCWGSGFDGQLGNGAFDEGSSVPVPVSGISDAVALALGNEHSCAIRSSGTVNCWGFNLMGELGNGTTLTSAVPVAVSGISTAVSIGAGYHSCVGLSSGEARCWGAGPLGSLGDGRTTYSSVPVPVLGLTSVRLVRANSEQSCALMASGQVRCWGAGGPGQLGDGVGQDSFVPVEVLGTGSGAIAELTVSTLRPGQRSLSARYPHGTGLTGSTSAPVIHDVARLNVAFVGGGAIFAPTDACAPVMGNQTHPVSVRYTAAELSGLPSGVSIFWPDGAEHLALWGPMAQSSQFLGGAGRAVWSRFVFYPTRPLIRVVNRQVHSPEGAGLVQAQELTLRLRVQNFAATPGCSVTLSATLHRDAS